MTLERGTCKVCKRTDRIISVNEVCIRCYGKVRHLRGSDRTTKLMKIMENNTIKLTMWDLIAG